MSRQELVRDGETLAAPLLREKRLLGAIAVAGPFGAADGGVLTQVATETALALENTRLLREMRAVVAAKDAVLAVASHEITTPLAALAGYAELCSRVIETEHPNLPALERAVDGLRRTTDRVLELSRRLLDSERVRTGKLVMERHTVDILPGLREVIERMSIAAGRLITFDARTPALVGSFDRVRVEEVLQNLISNALRYSPPENPVHVVAEIAGAEVRLRVIDRGIGIPESDRSILFSAFRRGANARAGGPGLGLGLHLASEIVRAHGGRIWFDTSAGGTTFYVAFPLS
jgi:signal transduction histidine kinase